MLPCRMNSTPPSVALRLDSPASALRHPLRPDRPLTPLFATHTSRPQLTENPTALSPFLATHTDFSFLPPLFATHTKTTGVYINSSQNDTRRLRRKGTHHGQQNHEHRQRLDSASLPASFS